MLSRDELAETCSSSSLPEETREELILQHLPQVRLIARQIRERMPMSVSFDDLVSAGILGLIAAIDRFDSEQRVKLRTYAEYKIRGAMLDSLRGMDWASRQQRRRGRMIEAAIALLEHKLNRVPTEEEIADELGVTLERYQDWLSAARSLTIGSLESVQGEDDGRSLLRHVSDRSEKSPAQIVEQAELETLLASAITQLPEVEKTILSLYYYEEMTLREIASILDLHESRISQLKSQAILRIRSVMGSS